MHKKYLLRFCFLPICISFSSAFAQKNKEAYINVENNATVPQQGYIVSIPWRDIVHKHPTIDTADFMVFSQSSKREIVFQLEYLGKKEPQNLLLQVDIIPGRTEKLILKKSPPSKFESKTYCRYVPERKDDFAWENDKIAFRVYGQALEGTKENANGIDVWVKRTNKLVINERYKLADYHTDHGDGVDYYHVGLTLGAGNMAPFVDDSIFFPKNYRKWTILDNGPLRSTFELVYAPWEVAGTAVGMTKTISIDAGDQLSRISINLSNASLDSLPVVVGITMREEQADSHFDKSNGIMAYWEPTDPKFGTTGVGCILLEPVHSMQIAKEHLLSQFKVKTNKTFTYYTGAAWDRAQEITNMQAWKEYLNKRKEQLNIVVHGNVY